MTTYAPEARVHRPHLDSWLVAVITLSAALVALGAWVVVDRYAGPEDDATALIDNLNAAFSTGDTDAATSLFADKAVLVRDDGGVTVGAEAIGALAGSVTSIEYETERVAPVTLDGDFATTFMRYTSSIGKGTQVGVFQFKNGKILRFWFFKLGVTPPFDNAIMP